MTPTLRRLTGSAYLAAVIYGFRAAATLAPGMTIVEMPAQTHLFPCFTDNFGVLLHDPETGATAVDRCARGGAGRGGPASGPAGA